MQARRTPRVCTMLAPAAMLLCAHAIAGVWEDVDIIPMPKQIELRAADIPLAGASIVLGEKPSRQSEIGAEWINRRLVQLGSEPLAMVSGPLPVRQAPRLLVVVGTREDNPLIDRACSAGLVDVGPENPGPKGYEIRTSADGDTIYLSGADAIGALYACVTFAELIEARESGPVWRQAVVRDWPDIQLFSLGGVRTGSTLTPELNKLFHEAFRVEVTDEFRERFLEAMKAHYDRLLRWKVSHLELHTAWEWERGAKAENLALVREAIQYGRERGIGALSLSLKPFVCPADEQPELVGRCLPPGRYEDWVRCWSMDEIRQETARRLAEFVKQVGYTDVWFHDTDTGGFENPAQWNERCETCRQRWGDDYVAATVHIHRIYYDALKAALPNLRIHFCVYPYNIDVLDPEAGAAPAVGSAGWGQQGPEMRERYEDFWRRMAAEMPRDVTFACRETKPGTISRFRELIAPHGVFMGYWEIGDRGWTSFFNESPQWIGSFGCDERDLLYCQTVREDFVPLRALATIEYAWNGNAPGAEPFARLSERDQWRHSIPEGEFFDTIVPHVVRGLFGRRAGPELVEALKLNVDPARIFDDIAPGDMTPVNTITALEEQSRAAERGRELMDAVWARRGEPDDMLGMDEYAFRRLIYLREVFHCSAWMAKARYQKALALKLIDDQQPESAADALNTGLVTVTQAREAVAALKASRPPDPVWDTPGKNAYEDLWRAYTADALSFDGIEKELQETLDHLPEMGPIPQWLLEYLSVRRKLRAVRATQPVTIDGLPQEDAWAAAYPIEAFLVDDQAERPRVARAHTRAKLLYDDTALYLGVICRPPIVFGSAPAILPDDAATVLFRPQGWGDERLSLTAHAAGDVVCQRGRLVELNGALHWEPNADWTCGGFEARVLSLGDWWTLEARVPLQALGVAGLTDGWSGAVYRDAPFGDEVEYSSVQSPTVRRYDQKGLRPLVPCGDEQYLPEFQIEAVGMDIAPQTLPDRIVTAAELGIGISANQVLTGVTLTAEAYGPDGRLQSREELLARDRLFYTWTAPERFQVCFDSLLEQGGIRLVLDSNEGSAERWVRIGGWEGQVATGGVFRAGDATSPVGDFRSTQCLADPISFMSVISANGVDVPLFQGRQGTVEFWVRPQWRGGFGPGSSKGEHCILTEGLFHVGVVRPEYPITTNMRCMTLTRYGSYGSLVMQINSPEYACWSANGVPEGSTAIPAGQWSHIACVWDADAPRENWVRLYVNGHLLSGLSGIGHEDRLPEDRSVNLPLDATYLVQLGSLNTGRQPANALFDELRISRIVRYSADFAPPTGELRADSDTSALFHFNGDLRGEGIAEDGQQYSFEGTAGTPRYY